MSITNLTQGSLLADQVEFADTPLKRMKGLLGRPGLNDGHALVISSCQSVHMVFMKFPIDVVFVDRSRCVVGLCSDLKPFAFSPIFWKSACAIELPTGTIDKTQTKIGDQLKFS